MIYGEAAINTTEDLIYSTEILLKAKKINLLNEAYYVYFNNTESLSLAINPLQLLERQIIILKQIKIIALKYEAKSQIINNILNYVEKDIFLAISQSAFLINGGFIQNAGLLNAFSLFPEMTDKRISKLSMAMANKYYSLAQVFLRFGIKTVLGIILRSLKSQVGIRNSNII